MIRRFFHEFLAFRSRFLLKNKSTNIYFGRRLILRGCKNISLGNDVTINDDVWLEAVQNYNGVVSKAKIEIGKNVSIGRGSIITSYNHIKIGNGCLLGPNVFITDHSHGSLIFDDLHLSPIKRNLASKGKVVIHENVWVGFGAVILPGVEIGHSSIIGANSVVTKNIEPYSVVVGNPARVIRNLNS